MALFGSIVMMLLGICVCIAAGLFTMLANGMSTSPLTFGEVLFLICLDAAGIFLVFFGAYYSPIHITVI